MPDETELFRQSTFTADIFAINPEPRCPCVLLLDTSGSMHGEPMRQLNEGFRTLIDELLEDNLARKRVEIAVVTFGPVQLRQDFATPDVVLVDPLETTGDTPMGEAIHFALGLVENRKETYRSRGVAYYRPWVFLITDGAPTDAWKRVAEEVRRGENAGNFAFFSIGVQGADMGVLSQISVRAPIKLQGLRFAEMFRWLSNSLRGVSRSTPGERIALPAPSGWSEV